MPPQWSLSLRFPHQNPVQAFPLPHTRFMPHPFQSSWFYHPRNSGWGTQMWMEHRRRKWVWKIKAHLRSQWIHYNRKVKMAADASYLMLSFPLCILIHNKSIPK
jgi:hypothetical protein